MTGLVCLQGGGEFSPGCQAMDRPLVQRAAGRVVVTALAGERGQDYASATARGVNHFRALGARDVVGAPDVRDDPVGALEVLGTARMLVLPGGSPTRLLDALRTSPVGDFVADLLGRDGVVVGASAGAMVLCPWTVLPDRSGPGALGLAEGLGVVAGVSVVPHWSGGSSRGDWLRALATTSTTVLGLPEESGVLVEGDRLTAVGRLATALVGTDRVLDLGETVDLAGLGDL